MPPGRGNHRRESRKAVRYGLKASCYILDEFAPGHCWNHDEAERRLRCFDDDTQPKMF